MRADAVEHRPVLQQGCDGFWLFDGALQPLDCLADLAQSGADVGERRRSCISANIARAAAVRPAAASAYPGYVNGTSRRSATACQAYIRFRVDGD